MRRNHSDKKKVLWVHNFPKKVASGGGWMYNQYEFMKEDVDLYFLENLRNPLSFVRHYFRLRKLSTKYEIMHAQYGSAVGFMTSLMPCKRILSLKGSDWYKAEFPSYFDKLRVRLGKFLTGFSIRRFDHIIVMSDAMKSEVEKQYPGTRITTIVDPIDLTQFRPLSEPRSDNKKRVLFASIQVDKPVKRYPLAKAAFDLLQLRMPNTELVIMSNVPHEEVVHFMNGVDVLLLTSAHEGWPNVVKEILACNKPFVSTDVSDLRRIADKSGNCFVCDATPEALSEGLYRALNAEDEDLRKHVEGFSMEKNIITLQEVYRQLQ